MALPFSITSPSTGKLFTSTFDALDVQGIAPTTPLPPSHPFTALWKEHLAALTSTQVGPYEAVIDALVSIAEESPAWREEEGMSESNIAAKMNGMRDMLSQHPPDVVIVSGVEGLYSFHPRRPSLWHVICISEEYVKLWVDADKRSDESAWSRRLEKLALTALLKTSFDHEIGHWLFTLVRFFFSQCQSHMTQPSNRKSCTIPIPRTFRSWRALHGRLRRKLGTSLKSIAVVASCHIQRGRRRVGLCSVFLKQVYFMADLFLFYSRATHWVEPHRRSYSPIIISAGLWQ